MNLNTWVNDLNLARKSIAEMRSLLKDSSQPPIISVSNLSPQQKKGPAVSELENGLKDLKDAGGKLEEQGPYSVQARILLAEIHTLASQAEAQLKRVKEEAADIRPRRSIMSAQTKSRYIARYGQRAFLNLPR